MIIFSGKTVIFIGNSITVGASASDNAHRWTTIFCANKGSTEVNMGISGQVLQNGTVCGRTVFDKTTIPSYSAGTHAALFISLGVNDIGLNNGTMTPEGFRATLLEAVDYAHFTKAWPYAAIVLVTPFYYTAQGYNAYVGACGVTTAANVARHESYKDEVSAVASLRQTVLLDAYTAMKNSSSPASLISTVDGIHPVDSGHAFIASFAAAQSFNPATPPPNVTGGKPTILFAKTTVDFITAGINAGNMRSIYLVDEPQLYFFPGASNNGITGFEAGKTYYLNAITDIDLSTILEPPF